MRLLDSYYFELKRSDPSFTLLGYGQVFTRVRVRILELLEFHPRSVAAWREMLASETEE